MHEIRPDKRAFNWLAVCAGLACLPYAGSLPAWLLLITAGFVAWRYLINYNGWRQPGRVLRWALLLLIITLVFQHYGTVFGRDAGFSFLIVLTGLKFLELKSLRDHVTVVFLCLLLVLGGFLYSQALLLGVYSFIIVIVCTASLYRLNQPAGVSPGSRLRLAFQMVLLAVPLMLVMYFLFPRIQGGLWGLPGNSASGVTGFSDDMRPGMISQLVRSDAIAFRADFGAQAIPPNNKLYWRGLILSHTDGRRWTQSVTPERVSDSPLEGGDAVSYEILLEPHQRHWLFGLDLPATRPTGARPRPGSIFESVRPVRERKQYRLTSYTRYNTGPISPRERDAALQLPPEVSPRVTALAQQWRDRFQQPLVIARAALSYFRNELFYYTLTPPVLGADPVDEFLFETRRGFCEHYAAAFTTLMRVAGVPARVVIGYQGGEYNGSGNYLIVRQQDAHAWSEIWIAGRGWQRVDPTAAVAPTRIEYGIEGVRRLQQRGLALSGLSSALIRQALRPDWIDRARLMLRQRWDALNVAWYRWTTGYDTSKQKALLAKIGMNFPSWLARLAALLAVVLVVTALIAMALLRSKNTVDPVQRLYLKFCRKLGRAGFMRLGHEGARDFAQRVSAARPDLAAAVSALTASYVALRYGRIQGATYVAELKKMVDRFNITRAS